MTILISLRMVGAGTNPINIPLYTMDISTKFETISYTRLGEIGDLRFKFAKLQGLNLRMF